MHPNRTRMGTMMPITPRGNRHLCFSFIHATLPIAFTRMRSSTGAADAQNGSTTTLTGRGSDNPPRLGAGNRRNGRHVCWKKPPIQRSLLNRIMNCSCSRTLSHGLGLACFRISSRVMRFLPSNPQQLRQVCVVRLLSRMRCGRFRGSRSLYVRWRREGVFSLKQR